MRYNWCNFWKHSGASHEFTNTPNNGVWDFLKSRKFWMYGMNPQTHLEFLEMRIRKLHSQIKYSDFANYLKQKPRVQIENLLKEWS